MDSICHGGDTYPSVGVSAMGNDTIYIGSFLLSFYSIIGFHYLTLLFWVLGMELRAYPNHVLNQRASYSTRPFAFLNK